MKYPHKMYKGSKVVVAKDKAQHLKFTEAGYGMSPNPLKKKVIDSYKKKATQTTSSGY